MHPSVPGRMAPWMAASEAHAVLPQAKRVCARLSEQPLVASDLTSRHGLPVRTDAADAPNARLRRDGRGFQNLCLAKRGG